MRYKMTLEYDGTPFVGWQTQNNGVSVQQVLEQALKICTREDQTVWGTGRTDTGVHAIDYVASFDLTVPVDCDVLMGSLNALVRPYPISVKKIEPVDEAFHARFSAKQRRYIYKIQNTRFPPALNAGRVWHYGLKLDADKMNACAQLLVGKHDFSTFRAADCQAKSPLKTLDEIRVWRDGDMVYVTVAAKSFLYHQVRNIVGTLVLVGNGKWTKEMFQSAFEAHDRTKGGPTAPAMGLYFDCVLY